MGILEPTTSDWAQRGSRRAFVVVYSIMHILPHTATATRAARAHGQEWRADAGPPSGSTGRLVQWCAKSGLVWRWSTTWWAADWTVAAAQPWPEIAGSAADVEWTDAASATIWVGWYGRG